MFSDLTNLSHKIIPAHLPIERRDLWKDDRTYSCFHFKNDAATWASKQCSGPWLFDVAMWFPLSTLQVAAVVGNCAVAAMHGLVAGGLSQRRRKPAQWGAFLAPPWPQAALLAVSSSIGLKVLDCIVGSLGHQCQETESFGHFCPMMGCAKQAVFLQLVPAAWGDFGGYNAKCFWVVLTPSLDYWLRVWNAGSASFWSVGSSQVFH